MGALNDIMTRFYDILRTQVGTPVGGISNITVGSTAVPLKTSRYYAKITDVSKLPHLAATFGEGAPKVQYGRDGDGYIVSDTQTITVWAHLNPMLSGANGTGETLAIAEPLVDAIKTCFLARTRLQLATESSKLDCLVKDIVLSSHSGLSGVGSEEAPIGLITFTFQVEYEDYITRI